MKKKGENGLNYFFEMKLIWGKRERKRERIKERERERETKREKEFEIEKIEKLSKSSQKKEAKLSLFFSFSFHLAAPSVNLVSTESIGAKSLTIESQRGAPVPEERTEPSSWTWTQKVVPGSPALEAALSSHSRHAAVLAGVNCQSLSCLSRDFSSWRCFSWREREE